MPGMTPCMMIACHAPDKQSLSSSLVDGNTPSQFVLIRIVVLVGRLEETLFVSGTTPWGPSN